MMLCQTLFMALSHSLNLVVYCLSNPRIRKSLCMKFVPGKPTTYTQSTTATFAMQTLPKLVGYRRPIIPSKETNPTNRNGSLPLLSEVRHSKNDLLNANAIKERPSLEKSFSRSTQQSELYATCEESMFGSIITSTATTSLENSFSRRSNSI